jgi:uncharacterized membrane protein YdfJ with MMPL/SSD domain
MTGSMGSFAVRRARLVLVAALLAVVGFGVLGIGAFGKLQTGGFQDPGAGSTTAQTLTDQRFGGTDGVVLLVHAETGTVIIDATLVRAVLVPACQRILGRAAWYAPAPLRRLQTRIALTEAGG